MEILKKIVNHAEVKRGASHLIVGVLIGLVSTLVFKEGAPAAK